MGELQHTYCLKILFPAVSVSANTQYGLSEGTHSKYSKYESPLDPNRIGDITKLPSAGLESNSEPKQQLNMSD